MYERHDQDSRYKPLGDVCETVSAKYGTGGGSEVLVLESNQNHATVKDTEVCPTLSASMGNGGGYVPMIVQTYKQYRYGIYVSSDHSATIRAESGKLDGGGSEVLIVYKTDDVQPVEPKRSIQSG